MTTLEEEKKRIKREIVELIATSLEKHIITTEDTSQIADYVLRKTKEVDDQEQLLVFLSELSHKWPLFQTIVDLEKGKVQKGKENEALSQISTFLKNNQLDEAVSTAKNLNENNNA